jgi:uncharacterized membrane protein YccC
LPVAVFLAAYTPSALSFLAGQAAFTVLMLVLFNVLSPVGWSVGLVRIEDLVVGSAIGVVVGTLLWPRGARSDFAHALARLYRLTAVHLSGAFDLALGHGRIEAVMPRVLRSSKRERRPLKASINCCGSTAPRNLHRRSPASWWRPRTRR